MPEPRRARAKSKRKTESPSDRILLSLREYSAHRKGLGLPGSVFSIQAAIRAGRISRTCSEHERCPPECKSAKIDPCQADLDWEAWTDPTRGDAETTPANIQEAQLARLTWQTREIRQRYEERKGLLIRKEWARDVLYHQDRTIRDRLLMLARRLAGRIMTLKDRKQVEGVIDRAIREALKELDRDVLSRKP